MVSLPVMCYYGWNGHELDGVQGQSVGQSSQTMAS